MLRQELSLPTILRIYGGTRGGFALVLPGFAFYWLIIRLQRTLPIHNKCLVFIVSRPRCKIRKMAAVASTDFCNVEKQDFEPLEPATFGRLVGLLGRQFKTRNHLLIPGLGIMPRLSEIWSPAAEPHVLHSRSSPVIGMPELKVSCGRLEWIYRRE